MASKLNINDKIQLGKTGLVKFGRCETPEVIGFNVVFDACQGYMRKPIYQPCPQCLEMAMIERELSNKRICGRSSRFTSVSGGF